MRTNPPTLDRLEELGWELNATQYRTVQLAAQYDDERDWFYEGLSSAAAGISRRLQIHSSTAREWIRVGHALRWYPLIDTAFAENQISYAKARIVTRFAGEIGEPELLDLAAQHSANRLTTMLAKRLAEDEDDEERDMRHHLDRGLTHYTDDDGMVVIRIVLPPAVAKMILAIINTLVQRIAQTAISTDTDPSGASADAREQRSVAEPATTSDRHASADAPDRLHETLREIARRWQPTPDDDWSYASVAQQRADAFTALFVGLDVDLTTEVVLHVRGDGNTFDDGTPVTSSAVGRLLDRSFIRLMLHDSKRTPLDATNRRRYATTRQKRVVMETHNHECVDCGGIDLLELDHEPPYFQTGHTITTELEPRCAPCHRARHRKAA